MATARLRPHEPKPASSNPRGLAAADFNGDGKADLAVAISPAASGAASKVSVLLGNGDGSFQAAVLYAVGSAPVAVATGDFDGDNVLDLAVANHSSDSVSILLGRGDGTFGTARNYAAGSEPFSVTAADLNGDGRLDLAIASGAGASILVGNGDGTFDTAVGSLTGTGPHAVAAADFSRDGKPDLAVANATASTVSILLNVSATISIEPAHLAGGEPEDHYTQVLSASGGTGPYTFSVAGGSLPPGLALSASGVLSGTPGPAGIFLFTVRVTDGGRVRRAGVFARHWSPAGGAPGSFRLGPRTRAETGAPHSEGGDLPWALSTSSSAASWVSSAAVSKRIL